MYLNPQDKRDNHTAFAFLTGVVCQAKTINPIQQDAQDTTYILDLDKSNLFSVDFAVSCFSKLEQLGYRYPDKKVPGGTIEWMNNNIFHTLSWIRLNQGLTIKIIYSEARENNESAKFFYI